MAGAVSAFAAAGVLLAVAASPADGAASASAAGAPSPSPSSRPYHARAIGPNSSSGVLDAISAHLFRPVIVSARATTAPPSRSSPSSARVNRCSARSRSPPRATCSKISENSSTRRSRHSATIKMALPSAPGGWHGGGTGPPGDGLGIRSRAASSLSSDAWILVRDRALGLDGSSFSAASRAAFISASIISSYGISGASGLRFLDLERDRGGALPDAAPPWVALLVLPAAAAGPADDGLVRFRDRRRDDDDSRAVDAAAAVDAPAVVDAPAAVDAPVAGDAPAAVDAPEAVDAPAVVPPPAGVGDTRVALPVGGADAAPPAAAIGCTVGRAAVVSVAGGGVATQRGPRGRMPPNVADTANAGSSTCGPVIGGGTPGGGGASRPREAEPVGGRRTPPAAGVGRRGGGGAAAAASDGGWDDDGPLAPGRCADGVGRWGVLAAFATGGAGTAPRGREGVDGPAGRVALAGGAAATARGALGSVASLRDAGGSRCGGCGGDGGDCGPSSL